MGAKMHYKSLFSVLRPVFSVFVSVGPLLAVFGFLPCRTAAVRSGDILFFLGFGFHFAVSVVFLRAVFEHYSAAGYNLVDVVSNAHFIS